MINIMFDTTANDINNNNNNNNIFATHIASCGNPALSQPARNPRYFKYRRYRIPNPNKENDKLTKNGEHGSALPDSNKRGPRRPLPPAS